MKEGKLKELIRPLYFFGDKQYTKRLVEQVHPDENSVAFYSEPDFSDNARALFDYMIEHGYNEKYKIYWFVRNPQEFKSFEDKNVFFESTRTLPFLGKKPIIKKEMSIKTHFSTHPTYRHEFTNEHVLVNLWHGAGYKMGKGSSFQNGKRVFDYIMTSGEIYIPGFAAIFCCKEEQVLPLGFPRNDKLKTDVNDAKTRQAFGLEQYEKMILWMPTFRASFNGEIADDTITNETGLPVVGTVSDFTELNEELAERKMLLLVKLHHLQALERMRLQNESNIRFVKDTDINASGIELYDLVRCADALLTDYSSISTDYMWLDRPIGYTLDDFDEYANSRGLYWGCDTRFYMPGNHIYNKNDLQKFLDDVINGRDNFCEERRAMHRRMNNTAIQSSSAAILDRFGIHL